MKAWNEITHYAGFDWARDHHDVIVVDSRGQVVADFQIEHTAEGWKRWREQIAALGEGVAACVETSQGVVVEHLLQSGVTVHPVSPASAKRCRERKVRERQQDRSRGCLEPRRRPACRWARLESPGAGRPAGGRTAAALP